MFYIIFFYSYFSYSYFIFFFFFFLFFLIKNHIEPYKINEEDVSIIHLTVVQSRYVYLTTNVTLPLVYDIKNGTWEEISWECDFIGPINIWNVVANDSDIFILGNFVMISDGITYTSIAKYNLESQR